MPFFIQILDTKYLIRYTNFMLNAIFGLFSHDLGIDLGTANTLIHVRGKGILIREPSVIAIHKKSKKVLAIGQEAKNMIGRTPASIIAVQPLSAGVISDFESTEKMLRYYIDKVHQSSSRLPKIPRPRVVIGIPSTVTEVEEKAVIDAAKSAGARKAYLIEEPMAAAIGAGLDVLAPRGSLIVDIGGGTTEVAIISLGGIVRSMSLKVAGYEFDQAIADYIRYNFNLLIGAKTAEDVKIRMTNLSPILKNRDEKDVVNALSGESIDNMVVRGRNLKTGLPEEIKIDSNDITEALKRPIQIIIDGIKDVIENTAPELVSDVIKSGVVLAGGGALLKGLPELMSVQLNTVVSVAKDPLTCVVRGCAIVLEDKDLMEKVAK